MPITAKIIAFLFKREEAATLRQKEEVSHGTSVPALTLTDSTHAVRNNVNNSCIIVIERGGRQAQAAGSCCES